MTDLDLVKEEHGLEIESLEAIYEDDFTLLEPNEGWSRFRIWLRNVDIGLGVCLGFELHEKYPNEEPPLIEIMDSEDLSPLQIDRVDTVAEEEAKANAGMQSIFTICSTVLECLNNLSDEVIEERLEAAKKADWRETASSKVEGTMCTIETFLVWQKQFLIDFYAQRENEKAVQEPMKLKPTGKELFLNDTNLAKSDLQFVEEGGDVGIILDDDNVEVDEALFQALDLMDDDLADQIS